MKIVKKKWGEEHWVCNTKLYCGKLLYLKKGYQTSIHRHLKKDETFYIMQGEIRLELGNAALHLFAGNSVRIKPRVWHRFTGLQATTMIEFSTLHGDKDNERKTTSRRVPDVERGEFGLV